MEINSVEGTTDPKPSPSPGPSPSPRLSKPEDWQVELDPPCQASKALATYVVKARSIFRNVADTLGTPDYAVPPPIAPLTNPPVPSADMTISLAGLAAASYSTVQNTLQGHSAEWDGADGTAVTITQGAATVGSAALRRVKYLVCRLQDVLNTTNLDRTVPASYTEHPSAGDGLTSYAEYRLVLTIEQTLDQTVDIVSKTQSDLGLTELIPLIPDFPIVPEGIVPPGPVPLPERQRQPQGPTVLEV